MQRDDGPVIDDAEHAPLVSASVVREMSRGCGWSVAEFAAFYAPRARAELAEIEAAHRRRDTDTVVRLAHGAAGSASSAGACGMIAAYRSIEESARSGDACETNDLVARARTRLDAVLTALSALGAEG